MSRNQVEFSNQPVVIDNGSGFIKAGFAGQDQPSSIFSSLIGHPKYKKVMGSNVDGDSSFFVGDKVTEMRGVLKLRHPMDHGVVMNWENMERIWNHTYELLKIQSSEHPVLVTDVPHNPRLHRERAAELFFETYNTPALYFSIPAVLSLYASGRTTGVVLDSGDGVTHTVPVFEGFALPHAITRIDIGGRDITNHLQYLLRRAGYNFRTSAELEVVRIIKEKNCYVAFDPAKEEELLEPEAGTSRPVQTTYTLPDGQTIDLGAEKFRAPELLFHPDIIGDESPGIHQCLDTSIRKSDMDLRKTLYSNIILGGGSTLFHGFGERLLNEVKKLAPKDVKIKISAPLERKYSAWIGGSIMASLSTFKDLWVTHQEYEEEGAAILHRKIL
ncbi:alpha-centractin [Cavenderia fasciculata]|uniref:Alpha-centractin n=1 Tax=Cavenderia fasciculata TaxID=261658 RepID=F4QEP2_CACFS|nr:alpha-centractin [Cavenderia fasciculata]EGG13303.1 alpha-centractin [Cavenderia fasciculata]|eukprot:XP_004350002.1 alpha-centractin [Cavenderia fasciculata]